MPLKKKVKSIEESLTKRQKEAIRLAANGDTFQLLRCVIETENAIVKVMHCGLPSTNAWVKGTLDFYSKIQTYLLEHIQDETLKAKLVEECGRMEREYAK